jgi:hypothetical protein
MSASSHASRAAYWCASIAYSRVSPVHGLQGLPYLCPRRAPDTRFPSTLAEDSTILAHYTDTILNSECREYGSATGMAAAHIEETRRHEILVILIATRFSCASREFVLPSDIDVAPRPVDIKGMCTTGPQDSLMRIGNSCRCCGVDYDEIPWAKLLSPSSNQGELQRRACRQGDIGISANDRHFLFVHPSRASTVLQTRTDSVRCRPGSKVRPESSGAETRRP